jgi:hypothetical protein
LGQLGLLTAPACAAFHHIEIRFLGFDCTGGFLQAGRDKLSQPTEEERPVNLALYAAQTLGVAHG